MSTLRPSDNPVDSEKKNNHKCASLSHIITIYAVSSGLCREATQRGCLEGDPQLRPIPLGNLILF